MNIDKFCTQCAARCDGNNRLKAKGFDFTIFVPLVLEVVIGFLKDCGEDDVVEAVAKRSFWARYATRKGVKQAARDEGIKLGGGDVREISTEIMGEASKAGTVGVKAMVAEAKNNEPDFMSVFGG